MLNLIQVIGYLGQDPELRYTPTGQPAVNFSVATTEVWMENNQKHTHTEWHRVVVWGKTAENCAKYLSKGKLAHVLGKVRTRSWVDKTSGETKYSTEIIAREVVFLPSGSSNTTAANQPPRQPSQAASAPAPRTPAPGNYPSTDDIPF